MKKWGRPAGLIVVQRDSKLPYTAVLELVQTHSTLQCWSPCDSNRIETFETHQTHLKPPNSAGLLAVRTWRQKLIYKMKIQRKSGKRKDSVVEWKKTNEECQARPKAAKRQCLCADLSSCDSLTEERVRDSIFFRLREGFGKSKPKSKRLMDATISRRHWWITHNLPRVSEVENFPFFVINDG